ncbi:MAG: sulfurtransferase [Proteobacteria bacterium]|nr:sulfurtransferase [Pseudomonadota bacterium]
MNIPNIGDSPLVNTQWLSEHLDDPAVRIVDARWCARFENGRGTSVDNRDAYLAGHIPGAAFVGMFEELSDPNHIIADMLAPPEQFSEVMSRLGIGSDAIVVAYDDMAFPLSSARLWWALSYYGHVRVYVLDGGLRQWRREGRPVSTKNRRTEPAQFIARPQRSWMATKQDVVAALGQPDIVIVDCLSQELFRGDGDRHQWGQRPGHIPGAVNVPFYANVNLALSSATAAEREAFIADNHDLRFHSPEKLRPLYEAVGVTSDREVITYCGRGYAAACGLLALRAIGHPKARLYDGSWSEWSADLALPTASG